MNVSLCHSPSVSLLSVSITQLLSQSVILFVSMSFSSPLTKAVVVETKQMVVVLAVTEVNEDVVVQYFSWKMFGFVKRLNYFDIF